MQMDTDVRKSRDRLLAFAFATADILLEADADLSVRFVAGATEALLDLPHTEIRGRRLPDLVAPFDRQLIEEKLAGLRGNVRLSALSIALVKPDGSNAWFILSGNRIEQISSSYYLTLTKSNTTADDKARNEATDETTGLLKRDAFTNTLVEQMTNLRSQQNEATLSFFDLPDLDSFADRAGERMTEQLLAEVGSLLRIRSAGQKSAGRIGHNRFALLHEEGINSEDLRAEIGDAGRRNDPDGLGLEVGKGSLKVPVSGFDERTGTRMLIYAINQFAEGNTDVTSDAFLQSSFRRVLKEALKRAFDFRRTLEKRGFHVVFQPVVSLLDHHVHHSEALARFPNSKYSVSEIVSLAENIGWAMDLDLIVFDKVLNALKSQDASGKGRDSLLSVNMSADSLMTDVFLSSLDTLFGEASQLRQRIIVEITESMSIRNFEAAERRIQHLRKKGHPVTLDDFGSGSASFSYIHGLTVDCIKVDGKYIRDMLSNPRDDAILKAMITLCRSLHIATVAEFVETEAQAERLREIGFDYAQGYFFGKPDRTLRSGTLLPKSDR